MENLRAERRGAALGLTLSRPAARNALSEALLGELSSALDAAAEDAAVRAVVIAGAGPVFCAGHDLHEVRSLDAPALARLFDTCSRVMTRIVRFPKPVIARVHGTATAAGCQLVASCDLAVASEDARFATPGVHIGLFCSTPMVALSRAVGRKAALEMLLTGAPVDAAKALSIGLVNRVVPAGQLDDAIAEYVDVIASKSPLTLAIGKEAFDRQAEMPLEDAYRFASAVMTRNMLARDAREGIDAFLEKRAPAWTGS